MAGETAAAADWRDIANGTAVPTPGMKYVDQPYVVKLKDGAWLCLVTVGPEAEGKPGNHTAALVSRDGGRTWSAPVKVCQSYAVPLVAPSGRLFALTPQSQSCSDDGGQTWSEPQKLSVEAGALKRVGTGAAGGYEGSLGWSVALPVVTPDAAYLPWARVGLGRPPRRTDVYFLRSANVLTEKDPARITWEFLPDGEQGLRGPAWDKPEHRSEEPHLVQLAAGTLYVVFRTDQGHIGQATSQDGGKSWSKPQALKYPDGRTIKNPLACPSLWKCANGKYLLWFHNHSGPADFTKNAGLPYADRNPAWVCGGVEKDGTISWSQPEVLLYGHDLTYHAGRLSYPGFIEDGGRYFIFETQKTKARMHEVPAAFLKALWAQAEGTSREVAREGLVLERRGGAKAGADDGAKLAALPAPAAGKGLGLEVRFTLNDLAEDQVLLDSRREKGGPGFVLTTTKDKSLRLTLSDGRRSRSLETDAGLLEAGQAHHAAFIVDGGAGVMWAVLDGRVCDGGSQRQFGWARLDRDEPGSGSANTVKRDPPLGPVGGGPELRVAPAFKGEVSLVRLYGRALLTSEAVANFHAGAAAAFRAELARVYQDLGKDADGFPNVAAIRRPTGWYFLTSELHAYSQTQFWGEQAAAACIAKKNQDPLPVILEFQRQCASQGVALIVVPVPGKVAACPGCFDLKLETAARMDEVHREFYNVLEKSGVTVLDLMPDLLALREKGIATHCQQDSHWSPAAVRLAAQRIAAVVRKQDWYAAAPKKTTAVTPLKIEVAGDLVELLKDEQQPKEKLTVEVVKVDGGFLESDRQSPLVLMGDSHVQVYNLELLADHAGLPDLLCAETGLVPDVVTMRADGINGPRVTLASRKDNLAGKKCVVWCFAAREFTEAFDGWKSVKVIR